MDLLLAEELTLLAYDDESGKTSIDMYLGLGIGGALLADLALADRVTVDDKLVTVMDPTPTGVDLLDEALARIAADPPRKPAAWVSRLRRGATERVLDRLVHQGLLRRESGRVLLVFPKTVYPAVDGAEERSIRSRLQSAVTRGGPVPGGAGDAAETEQRTYALVALVHACDLGRQVFPDVPRRELKAAVERMGEGDWAGKATVQAIAAVRAAVLSATAAAVTASTAGAAGSS